VSVVVAVCPLFPPATFVRPHDAKPARYADNGKGFDPQSERFSRDSALEGDGFERSVPRHGKHCCRGLTYASR
jgi:hypothetical protein